jgi:hypothetical protein
MIVVTSLALGAALLDTGGANYLAELYVGTAADVSPAVLLSARSATPIISRSRHATSADAFNTRCRFAV